VVIFYLFHLKQADQKVLSGAATSELDCYGAWLIQPNRPANSRPSSFAAALLLKQISVAM
jgi:hypothetical protein